MEIEHISLQTIILVASAFIGVMFGLQVVLGAYIAIGLRAASKERTQLNKEIYGLMKRIEGLTSSRREQILKHYDSILETLSNKLPTALATEVSSNIIATEAKILSRLAEIEPNLQKDHESRRKLEELVHSMEGLEQSIVVVTSDTVRNVMSESRRTLVVDGNMFDS